MGAGGEPAGGDGGQLSAPACPTGPGRRRRGAIPCPRPLPPVARGAHRPVKAEGRPAPAAGRASVQQVPFPPRSPRSSTTVRRGSGANRGRCPPGWPIPAGGGGFEAHSTGASRPPHAPSARLHVMGSIPVRAFLGQDVAARRSLLAARRVPCHPLRRLEPPGTRNPPRAGRPRGTYGRRGRQTRDARPVAVQPLPPPPRRGK